MRTRCLPGTRLLGATALALVACAWAQPERAGPLPREFAWRTGAALAGARPLDGDQKYSLKDPSVVQDGGRWHLFCTVRGKQRSHGVAYLSFVDWKDAARAPQVMLPAHPGFFCAP